MALSQKGAGYDFREHIKDPYVRGALDSLASQTQAIRSQGQFGPQGSPPAPAFPIALSVTVSGGIFTARISASNPPAGVRYRLQWDTMPNFPNPIEEELGTTTWQRQLSGQRLCFRVRPTLLASEPGDWVYFGSAANPTFLQG